jgi:hypothetical protein
MGEGMQPYKLPKLGRAAGIRSVVSHEPIWLATVDRPSAYA